MSFASPTFLFAFLPVVLGLHWLAPRGARNVILLVASLLFYAWTESAVVFVLVASIAITFWAVRMMLGTPGRRRHWLCIVIVVDVSVLVWFKYAGFAWATIRDVVARLAELTLPALDVALPAGVSFFVLQLLSYVLDVARGRTPAQRNLVPFALYVALFPQLVAGPIVRYATIVDQLGDRRMELADFAAGVRRFAVGLGKKVLIADTLGQAVDPIFAAPAMQLTAGAAWFGVVAYGLQIYFDFGGYSDMAVGLGRMFGFRLPENFAYPYAARSMREFWTRWHMTLTLWIRDYVLVALPRTHGRPLAVARNVATVFLLVGLWHGAAWHFLVWGALHGTLFIAEHFVLGRRLRALPRACGLVYLHAILVLNWPLFRCTTLAQAADYYAALAGRSDGGAVLRAPSHEAWLCLLAGVVGSAPWVPWLRRRWPWPAAWPWLAAATCCLLLAACWLKVAARTHTPFLYFRF